MPSSSPARELHHPLLESFQFRFLRRCATPRRAARAFPDVLACGGFSGANEGTREFALDVRRNRVRINSRGRQELPRVFNAVNARRLDFNFRESRRAELRAKLRFLHRARNAADPQLHASPNIRGYSPAHYHVGNRKTSARTQHAKGFAQHAPFVGGKIDHAVRNHHIHGIFRQRNIFHLSAQELHILDARFALILPRQFEHFVSHVQAVRFSARTYAARGKQHINSAARAEIEDNFAGLELRQRRGIAATKRRRHRLSRNRRFLRFVIEIAGDGVARAQSRRAATRAASRRHALRCFAVFAFHFALDAVDVFASHNASLAYVSAYTDMFATLRRRSHICQGECLMLYCTHAKAQNSRRAAPRLSRARRSHAPAPAQSDRGPRSLRLLFC